MKLNKNIAISDSGFIFNPDTGESFTANPMGLEILNMMKEGKDFEDVRKHILGKYRSDKDTVEKDYHDFITMMHQYNLLYNDGNEDI